MKILGSNFTVALMNEIDSSSLGDCTHSYQVIRLQGKMHPDCMMETLLHEIIEAINFKLELEIEHKAISALGASMFAVLKDNGVDLSPLMHGVK